MTGCGRLLEGIPKFNKAEKLEFVGRMSHERRNAKVDDVLSSASCLNLSQSSILPRYVNKHAPFAKRLACPRMWFAEAGLGWAGLVGWQTWSGTGEQDASWRLSCEDVPKLSIAHGIRFGRGGWHLVGFLADRRSSLP